MKKKQLLLGLAVAVCAICGGVSRISHAPSKASVYSLLSENVESMTFCEITKGDKVRLKCTGEGVCSTTYMGHTLTCDGKKCK